MEHREQKQFNRAIVITALVALLFAISARTAYGQSYDTTKGQVQYLTTNGPYWEPATKIDSVWTYEYWGEPNPVFDSTLGTFVVYPVALRKTRRESKTLSIITVTGKRLDLSKHFTFVNSDQLQR